MFIALLDEPTLFVFESEDLLIRDVEPPDAESIVRAIFDEHANPYEIEWLRPNIHRKGFFGIGSVTFGEYRVKKSGEPDKAALIRLLEENGLSYVNPPSYKEKLELLLNALRG